MEKVARPGHPSQEGPRGSSRVRRRRGEDVDRAFPAAAVGRRPGSAAGRNRVAGSGAQGLSLSCGRAARGLHVSAAVTFPRSLVPHSRWDRGLSLAVPITGPPLP